MTFQKGQSGNPKGRPKQAKSQKSRIIEGFKKHLDIDAERFAVEMMHDAIAGGDSSILKLLVEYINGKPVQQNENLNINVGGELDTGEAVDRLENTEAGRNILRLVDKGCSDADKATGTE